MTLIRIVTPGVYNDSRDLPHTLVAGDTLETRAWYADELIRLGYAERALSITKEIQQEAPARAKSTSTKYQKEVDLNSTALGDLPGISDDLVEEMNKVGIYTYADLLGALEKGTLVNVPGIGIKKMQLLKKHFEFDGYGKK
jgi:hypothetical protein